MTTETRSLYEFGPYQLDAAKRLLTRTGTSITLAPKTFDLLLMLVEGRGRVFTKKELMNALWPESFVEDGSLQFQIASLRRALGEEWIETLPRYGYRLKGDISEIKIDLRPDSGVNTVSGGERVLEATPLTGSVMYFPARVTVSQATLRYGLVLLAILSIVFFITTRTRKTPPFAHVVRLSLLPPEGVMIPDLDSVSISPDGENVIFLGVDSDGKKQLWLRSLNSTDARRIRNTEMASAAPFWSPDGRSIAYIRAGKLQKLDLQSEASQTICDAPTGNSSGTWNKDGVILFHSNQRPGIYRVSAKGGAPQLWESLSTLRRETHQYPQFLPDGRHFIYFVRSEQAGNSGIYVSSLDSKDGKQLVNAYTNGMLTQLSGSSYLLYTRGSDLVAQYFDLAKLELTGKPLLVAQQIVIEQTPSFASALISASANGILAYRIQADDESKELVWVDRSGRRVGSVGGAAAYSNPSLSPDEKKLLVGRTDMQIRTRDLWLFDLPTGASTRFTFDPADESYSAWSPDSRRIAFNSVHDISNDIYEKDSAGISEPKLILHSSESKLIRGWSPDGQYLLFEVGPNTWFLPMNGSGKPLGPYQMQHATISPNGKWVAYSSEESGRTEVYVQAFLKFDQKWQISTEGGTEPVWRKDGKELFYISGSNELVAVHVNTESPAFESGVSKPLFKANLEARVRRRYQVAANGERFLLNMPVKASSPITVMLNSPAGFEH